MTGCTLLILFLLVKSGKVVHLKLYLKKVYNPIRLYEQIKILGFESIYKFVSQHIIHKNLFITLINFTNEIYFQLLQVKTSTQGASYKSE